MIEWYDRQGDPIDIDAYTALVVDPDYKIVKQEQVGPYWVSTVWLGLDHSFFRVGPPILFETMIFPECEYLDRYATEAEALAGHDEIVTLIRATEAVSTSVEEG